MSVGLGPTDLDQLPCIHSQPFFKNAIIKSLLFTWKFKERQPRGQGTCDVYCNSSLRYNNYLTLTFEFFTIVNITRTVYTHARSPSSGATVHAGITVTRLMRILVRDIYTLADRMLFLDSY